MKALPRKKLLIIFLQKSFSINLSIISMIFLTALIMSFEFSSFATDGGFMFGT